MVRTSIVRSIYEWLYYLWGESAHFDHQPVARVCSMSSLSIAKINRLRLVTGLIPNNLIPKGYRGSCLNQFQNPKYNRSEN